MRKHVFDIVEQERHILARSAAKTNLRVLILTTNGEVLVLSAAAMQLTCTFVVITKIRFLMTVLIVVVIIIIIIIIIIIV